jgi:tetratricopeptide (TPR) repeat protein
MDFEKNIKEAVDTREKGNLEKSRELFESLLAEVEEQLKRDATKEIKFTYATVLGEYVIQLRLEASDTYGTALQLGKQLYEFDKENDLNNPLSIRSVSNTLLDLSAYEEAEEYLNKLLHLYKGNSAQEGDTMAHLAYCMLRTGRTEKAAELIEKALLLIEKNSAKKEKIESWYSNALMVKAMIKNAQGDGGKAVVFAEKALAVAEKGQVVKRIAQANHVLSFLKNKHLETTSEII